MVVVAVGAAGASPAPGLHGRALGVTLALLAFAMMLLASITRPFSALRHRIQAAVIAAMAAAGICLVALQPQGPAGLATGIAVWMAIVRLPLIQGIALSGVTGIALDGTAVHSGSSPAAVLADTLLLALLGMIAFFIQQARASQDNTELLFAQLEDARDAQTRAAAFAERGRIAGELHDVLAHSLSGAAIQLQAARMLAERDEVSVQVRTAIDRSGELVKTGLANARQAVDALRGDKLPGVDQLEVLVSSFRDDTAVDAVLTVEGGARSLPAAASLALYRGAQEALTNIVRYAPGATAHVVLRYEDGGTTLSVEDHLPAGSTPGEGLAGVGGGRGLTVMRERIEQVGGSARAGPTGDGWRVELVVPA